jgi:hypothetical protein
MLHGRKATSPLFGKRHTPDESRQKRVAATNVSDIPVSFIRPEAAGHGIY